jgi:hypothetical protein
MLVRPGRVVRLFLDEQEKWAPVVPADLHMTAPPEPAADGTIACGLCGTRVPLARTEVVNNAYACAGCCAAVHRAAAQSEHGALHVDTKLGRGRWWLTPLLLCGAVAIVAALWFAT